MFGEYVLRPDARGKVLYATFSMLFTFVMGPVITWIYLALAEPDTLNMYSDRFYLIIGVIFIAGGISSYRTYRKLISFRMISTHEGLEITTQTANVTIRYDAITRLERIRHNILLVYTMSSLSRPVVAISDTITNRIQLETILQQFAPIEESNRLPFSYRKYARPLISTFFFAVIMIHFAAFNPLVSLLTGSITAGFCIYLLIIRYRFRNEIPFVRSLLLVLFIIAFITLRVIAINYPQLFP